MELVATGPEVFCDEPAIGIRATSLHVDCVYATSTMDGFKPGALIVDGSDRNMSVGDATGKGTFLGLSHPLCCGAYVDMGAVEMLSVDSEICIGGCTGFFLGRPRLGRVERRDSGRIFNGTCCLMRVYRC